MRASKVFIREAEMEEGEGGGGSYSLRGLLVEEEWVK